MRKEELNMEMMQYWGLVSRYFVKTTDLNRADLELLIYLNPFPAFTIHEWKSGEMLYYWDKKRFYRLQKDEWITKTHEGRGRTGGHSKYVVSSKGKRLINRIGRILDGREDLPETILKKERFTDNLYNQAIRAFNRREV